MAELTDKTVAAETAKPASNVRSLLQRVTSGPALVGIVLIVLVLVFGVLSPENRFFSSSNLLSIGSNSTTLLLLAVGLTFVLGAGHIDLSVAMNLVLSSVVAAKVTVGLAGTPAEVAAGIYPAEGMAIAAGAAAGIACGTFFGLINGLIVTKMKIGSFVATLGTMGVLTGLFNIITGGSNVNFLPLSLQRDFGFARWWGIPAPMVLGLVVAVVAGIMLARTVFGRHVLAIGSSDSAARRSGVKADSVTIRVFVIAGFLAGVAGVLDLTKFGTTALAGHGTDVMQALSAVIIGGTSLFGGIASMTGTVIAAVLLTVLTAGFVMLGVPPFYQYIAVGAILILAVWVDSIRRRNRSA